MAAPQDDDLDKRQQMASGAAPAAPDAAPASAPSSSPAAAALAIPSFAAFVAQRAKELQIAQDISNKRQIGANLANDFVGVSAALRGKDPDKALLDANNESAQRPVAQALQRQAAADSATKDYATQQAIAGTQLDQRGKANELQTTLDSQRPNTPISHRGYMLAVAQGLIPASYPEPEYTESMRQDMLKGATIQQAREAHLGTLAQSKEKLAEDAREHNLQHTDRQAAIEQGKYSVDARTGQIFNTKTGELLGNAAGGLPLHPNDAAKLDALLNGAESINRVKAARADGVVPGVGDYDATLKSEAPALAAADSGTGRASGQNDILKRAPNLYNIAGSKVFDEDGQRYIQTAKDRIAALKQAGYNVSEQEAHLARLEKSGTTARVNLFDPIGKPINLPPAQVDAYLQAHPGAKRAGH